MKRTGIISDLNYKSINYKIIYWVMIVILTVIAAMCILPPLWVLVSSLKSLDEFYSVPPTLLPKSVHFEKIPELWNKYNFGREYANTLVSCAGSILFSVVINGLMGYALSKMKIKGSKIVFGCILATYMLPTTVCMVPVYKNIISFPVLKLNLLNTFWPMWLMAGANAFLVIVYKSFFDGIPAALLEAGELDGCSEFALFTKIVLPLSKPVIATSIILTFNGAWGDFFWPYMVLKEKELYTIMVDIFLMRNDTSVRIDTILLALSFAIVPPAIIFMIFQKRIMNGFTMSGIKG